MIAIDGSYGEGGGQVLRTALTLACITMKPFEISNIRANRSQAGLRPQHLACVEAATDITGARITGDYIGSTELTFQPRRKAKPGNYAWEVKTAGSATLVMQTVILPLALAKGASQIKVKGGTHVPFSPSAHYLRDVYAPMLVQSGVELSVEIDKYGWYPKGGGEISAKIDGWSQLQGQDLRERGELERIFGVGIASNLPVHVPQRLSTHAHKVLNFLDVPLDIRAFRSGRARSAGAGLFVAAEYSNGRAGFGALGERGYPSENVAEEAAYALQIFHAGNASVDEFLADQLLLVGALAHGETVYIAPEISNHARTNAWTIKHFLDVDIQLDDPTGLIRIGGAKHV